MAAASASGIAKAKNSREKRRADASQYTKTGALGAFDRHAGQSWASTYTDGDLRTGEAEAAGFSALAGIFKPPAVSYLKEGRAMADGTAGLDLGQLVADHHAVLYRYAYRLSGSVSDAEDLTQQTFLAAHQKRDQLREPAKARSWLFAILRNNYLKTCRQRPPGGVPADVDVATLADTSADGAIDKAIDSEHLQTVINGLADEFKTVVLMFYFEHSSYRDIAEQLAIPPGTVMSRLARAKAHLRRALSEPQMPAKSADCELCAADHVAEDHVAGGRVTGGNSAMADQHSSEIGQPGEMGIPAVGRPL